MDRPTPGMLLLALALGFVACASPAPADPTPADGPKSWTLTADDDRAVLTTGPDGVSLADFIGIGQSVCGTTFAEWRIDDLEDHAARRINLPRRIEMSRDEFFTFWQMELYRQSVATLIRGEEDRASIEIVVIHTNHSHARRGSDAVFVPATELEDQGPDSLVVLTSVPLRNVTAEQAMARLRPLATEAVTMSGLPKAVLLQGPLGDVRPLSAEIHRLDAR